MKVPYPPFGKNEDLAFADSLQHAMPQFSEVLRKYPESIATLIVANPYHADSSTKAEVQHIGLMGKSLDWLSDRASYGLESVKADLEHWQMLVQKMARLRR